ncbi:MAG: 16S rRNA (guanine(527)-N(7))-methyltransferase RsmG [Vicinamibacterales bacterium]
MPSFEERLADRARKARVEVPFALAARLTSYYQLLDRWNEAINLTSLSDPDEAIDRLLLEPLAAARFLPASVSLVDLGSGGGSPAIPLALALEAARLVMVESRVRKSAFLREAVRQLDFSIASVETARFEELTKQPDFRESFGAVSIRAVRIDPLTLLAAASFLRPGGLVALFRGPEGPDRPQSAPEQLAHVQTERLLPHSTSRLTVLRRV